MCIRDSFSASHHVEAILRHSTEGLIDIAVVNKGRISDTLKRKYARETAHPVEIDAERLRAMGLRVVSSHLLEQTKKVRHDPDALARVVLDLAAEGRRRRKR